MTYAYFEGRPRAVTPLVLVVLVVTGFLAYSVPPYLTGGSRVPPTFTLHHPLLVAHVLLATVAMVAVVAQMWAKRSRLHPWIGRVYVFTALPAAASALVIGAMTPFGPILAVSNVILATLWLWFTLTGYRHGRRRRFAAHRVAMIYSGTLALSVITNRIWTPLLAVALIPLQQNLFGGDHKSYVYLVAGLGGWLGWLVPLAAVRWWMTRRCVTVPSPEPHEVETPSV
ncbi:hypothetical protein AU195_13595 [Mycobacterium sp. IS-1496]|uniref:DUF2306 domain-containing protein n=1 Tax=Mycobacterium sp. IS-1496 TaxID=1772284 RepID=UPI0007417363|nr:DUF2306 domain-containing protein [Mycobacterium sp. IS-1496]KUI26175.1 hypothetical protein AU195_13595 [Mycobacterium sp. IS-1496]